MEIEDEVELDAVEEAALRIGREAAKRLWDDFTLGRNRDMQVPDATGEEKPTTAPAESTPETGIPPGQGDIPPSETAGVSTDQSTSPPS